MFSENRVGMIIPALNEEEAIGEVLSHLPAWPDRIVVVDNGSTDGTAEIAAQNGAEVVSEKRRGYGAACLAGLRELTIGVRPDIVLFMDADRSDDPADLPAVLEPLARDEADLVIGSRVLGNCEPGSLTPPQRFGNVLSSFLLRLIWNIPCTDLGPFRAMRLDVLETLGMSDLDYGWTVQMQARAARMQLRICEVPVAYRKRVGRSKISGTIRGVFGAGTKILGTIAREFTADRVAARNKKKLIVFSRLPLPGSAKTRLIPAIGAKAAAELQQDMTKRMLNTAEVACGGDVELEVRYTGGTRTAMASMFGFRHRYCEQGTGDLGEKLSRSFDDAFRDGARNVICVGSDCPEIDTPILKQAFHALKTHDVVVGPAADGGYYLIGTRVPAPALFKSIDWGTPQVLQQTMDKLKSLRLGAQLLPELHDVDVPDDLNVWQRAVENDRKQHRGLISVIIPTLKAGKVLAAAIHSARQDKNVELIVADGGSTDDTLEVAEANGATIVNSSQGRAQQLNAGASVAQGECLLFLHADTVLPFGYARFVRQTCAQRQFCAGAFRMAFDATSHSLRLVESGTAIRSRLFQLPYGDQGLFLRREIFEQIGGFPTNRRMEDYELVTMLRQRGRIAISDLPALTSAAKYLQDGVIRTVWKHQRMLGSRHYEG